MSILINLTKEQADLVMAGLGQLRSELTALSHMAGSPNERQVALIDQLDDALIAATTAKARAVNKDDLKAWDQLYNRSHKIDPRLEEDWSSMALGFLLGRGCALNGISHALTSAMAAGDDADALANMLTPRGEDDGG